ncbi:hypothetical protein B0H17DRAFT_1148738 [Mycena rosella]|uniref:Uncharacterized protein n=1 Tax=Mycena rosella TaxID=1033263 RepID=A0AAD7FXJ6_MYCRO|nr:hypothetical protein B0H17DRAFT_1148738 [Mycena rosella]
MLALRSVVSFASLLHSLAVLQPLMASTFKLTPQAPSEAICMHCTIQCNAVPLHQAHRLRACMAYNLSLKSATQGLKSCLFPSTCHYTSVSCVRDGFWDGFTSRCCAPAGESGDAGSFSACQDLLAEDFTNTPSTCTQARSTHPSFAPPHLHSMCLRVSPSAGGRIARGRDVDGIGLGERQMNFGRRTAWYMMDNVPQIRSEHSRNVVENVPEYYVEEASGN